VNSEYKPNSLLKECWISKLTQREKSREITKKYNKDLGETTATPQSRMQRQQSVFLAPF